MLENPKCIPMKPIGYVGYAMIYHRPIRVRVAAVSCSVAHPRLRVKQEPMAASIRLQPTRTSR